MTKMVLTRRQFVAASAAFPFALKAMAEPAVAPRWVLLGTDAGKGIYRAKWDAAAGELGAIDLAFETARPDFIARHPTLPVLYTVNSIGNGGGGVLSLALDEATAGLTLINRVGSHGDGPCYVSIDRTGREVFWANYTGGSVGCSLVETDGRLMNASVAYSYKLSKPGTVPARQDASHMHCATVAPGNEFLLACDLGADLIRIYRIGMEAGDKSAYVLHTAKARMQPVGDGVARAGSGPRHVAFHPNGRWVYCIHEVDCTVDLFDWKVEGDKASMKLREGSVVSTLKAGVAVQGNTACEIVVSDDGRFVYTCTRGVDEILVYRVDAETGFLSEQQRIPSGGKVPRYIALDPSRKWLVCCNQGVPGNVVVFAHDAATAKLSETGKTFAAETPMFLEWV